MTDTIFAPGRLDVHRLAIEFTAESFAVVKDRGRYFEWLHAALYDAGVEYE